MALVRCEAQAALLIDMGRRNHLWDRRSVPAPDSVMHISQFSPIAVILLALPSACASATDSTGHDDSSSGDARGGATGDSEDAANSAIAAGNSGAAAGSGRTAGSGGAAGAGGGANGGGGAGGSAGRDAAGGAGSLTDAGMNWDGAAIATIAMPLISLKK